MVAAYATTNMAPTAVESRRARRDATTRTSAATVASVQAELPLGNEYAVVSPSIGGRCTIPFVTLLATVVAADARTTNVAARTARIKSSRMTTTNAVAASAIDALVSTGSM
jgi:hypothetical protein